jgi:hypothetical protein
MKILYVDQTGQLGGGELSLLDWLSRSSKGARVALFEDGPLRPLLEELGIPVEVLTLGALKTIRRESGLATVFCALPALIVLRQKLSEAAANADILYANSQKAFFLTAIAKRSRQPLVWHLQLPPPPHRYLRGASLRDRHSGQLAGHSRRFYCGRRQTRQAENGTGRRRFCAIRRG